MNLLEINELLSFCSNRGIDFLTASDSVKQAMLDLHKYTTTAQTTVTTITTSPPATKVAQVVKAGTTDNLVDGVYPFRGRRAYNDGDTYKVSILDVALPAGKVRSPNTDKIPAKASGIIEKLWKNNPKLFSVKNSHGGRGHQDTSENVGEAHFCFDKNSNISKISKIVWYPIASSVQADPIPVPVKAPVTSTARKAAVSDLSVFSVLISKTDPQLLADKMMALWQYNASSTDTLNDENIVGRLGELALHRKYSSFEWFNKDLERVGPSDFKITDRNLTLDIKTIKTIKNNLLLKKKKVDTLSLSDIFCLAVVEDIGADFRITFLGFISKEDALRHIVNYPPCYMQMLDSYKIDKRYLSQKLDLDVVFPTV